MREKEVPGAASLLCRRMLRKRFALLDCVGKSAASNLFWFSMKLPRTLAPKLDRNKVGIFPRITGESRDTLFRGARCGAAMISQYL